MADNNQDYETDLDLESIESQLGLEAVEFDEPEPESTKKLSQSFAAQKALEQGATFGFGDEAQAAIETLGHMIGVKGLGADNFSELDRTDSIGLDFDKAKQIYKDYRDRKRGEYSELREEFPKTALAGEIAGGLALPASLIGKTVGKGLSLGDKVVQGAKIGARAGAIAGTGYSEEEDIDKIIKDAGMTALGGAIVGAALPIGVEGIKSLTKWHPIERAMKLHNARLEGKKLMGKAAWKKAGFKLKDEAENFYTTVKEQVGLFADNIDRELAKADKTGVTADIADSLNKNLQRVSYLKNVAIKNGDDAFVKDLTRLQSKIQTRLKGPEEVVGFRPKAKLPVISPEEKAINQLKEQQTKLQLLKEGKYDIKQGKSTVNKKIASEIVKNEKNINKNLDNLVDDLGLHPDIKKTKAMESKVDDVVGGIDDVIRSTQDDLARVDDPVVKEHLSKQLDKLNRAKEYTSNLKPKEFSSPLIETEPSTGKRVIYAVEQNTGEVIALPVDKFDPSNITRVNNPSTGVSGLKLVDKDSGKVYFKPVKEADSIFTEITPIKGRSGAETNLKPSELSTFRKGFQELTELGDESLKTPRGKREAQMLVDQYGDVLTKAAPDARKAQQQYSQLKQILNTVNLDGINTIEDVHKSLLPFFSKVEATSPDSLTRQTLYNDLLTRLRKVKPELASKLNKQIKEAADNYELSSYLQRELSGLFNLGISSTGYGVGALKAGTKELGKAAVSGAKKTIGTGFKKSMGTLTNKSPDELNYIATKLTNKVVDPAAEKLGNILTNLAGTNDPQKRKAIVFGLMQNPTYRRLMKKVPELAQLVDNQEDE
jgi:hypothetical protein